MKANIRSTDTLMYVILVNYGLGSEHFSRNQQIPACVFWHVSAYGQLVAAIIKYNLTLRLECLLKIVAHTS
jgi:hypothetical protein